MYLSLLFIAGLPALPDTSKSSDLAVNFGRNFLNGLN